MPILRVPEAGEGQKQGDILKGLKLLATGMDWHAGGGSVEELTTGLSIVISRPCVIENKPQIVVAAIEARTENVPSDVRGFEKVKAYLRDLRDGLTRPDRFYLGQIPGEPPGRYYAKFDSLHTIALPPQTEMKALLAGHRVAVLTDEFVRDLHTRIFNAFSNLGFDDVGWYSSHDLQWLINEGEHALQEARAAMSELKAKQSELHAAGTAKPKQIDEIAKRINNHFQATTQLELEIGQLQAELTKR